MVSQTVEYAMRAMVRLSDEAERPHSVKEVSTRAQIPGPYLSKLLQILASAGLVYAYRGRKGGYVLARPAEAITVLDIVTAVDPVKRIRTCASGAHHEDGGLCLFHQRMDEAAATVERGFASVSLADLRADRVNCATANLEEVRASAAN